MIKPVYVSLKELEEFEKKVHKISLEKESFKDLIFRLIDCEVKWLERKTYR